MCILISDELKLKTRINEWRSMINADHTVIQNALQGHGNKVKQEENVQMAFHGQ